MTFYLIVDVQTIRPQILVDMRVSPVTLSQRQLHLSQGIRASGDEEDDEFSDSSNSNSSDQTFEPEDFISTTTAGSMETPQNDINSAMEEINSGLMSSTSTMTLPPYVEFPESG